MDATLGIVQRYGYALVFAFVLVEQIGLPLPAVPILLTMGALSAAGSMSLPLILGVALAAALPVDLVWHQLGRVRGHRILSALCKIALEPDSCVRRSGDLFTRFGTRALLLAKFVPGFTAVAAPLAGVYGVARWRFILYDAAAVILWAGTWTGLGYLFADAIGLIARAASRLGTAAGVLAAVLLAAWILFKYWQRWRFIRSLRTRRISPDEVERLLGGGADVLIVDLRSAADVEAHPFGIPGSLWMTPEEIEARHREIPRDREIVLYCT
jgi:membrane protein DedA with SNARE-associated domain